MYFVASYSTNNSSNTCTNYALPLKRMLKADEFIQLQEVFFKFFGQTKSLKLKDCGVCDAINKSTSLISDEGCQKIREHFRKAMLHSVTKNMKIA